MILDAAIQLAKERTARSGQGRVGALLRSNCTVSLFVVTWHVFPFQVKV